MIGEISTLVNEEVSIDLLRKVNLPIPPDGFETALVNVSKGKIEFHMVDNPGEWSRWCSRPVCNTKGNKKYISHALPAGVQPVPVDSSTNKRMCGNWTFFYSGWERQDKKYRRGAKHQTCSQRI